MVRVAALAIACLSVGWTAAAQAEPAVSPSPSSQPASAVPTGAPSAEAPATGAPSAAAPPPAVVATEPAPVSEPALAPAPAASAAPPAPTVRRATSPAEALVHVAVSYKDAWLEMRSFVDGGDFLRVCRAPCDLRLSVEGREARVTAAGMTTSNVFRFDGGDGTAGVRVSGGSASARRAGIITLAVGIPLALVGMALFAQGRVKHNDGMVGAGVAGLALGGVGIGVSLPLLLLGTTHVKNAKGSLIATSEPQGSAL